MIRVLFAYEETERLAAPPKAACATKPSPNPRRLHHEFLPRGNP